MFAQQICGFEYAESHTKELCVAESKEFAYILEREKKIRHAAGVHEVHYSRAPCCHSSNQ